MTNVIPLFPEHPVSHPSRGLSGVWWLRDGMVFVRSEHGMKPTQIGGSVGAEETLARIMLRELADEAAVAKGITDAPPKAVRDLFGAVQSSLRNHKGGTVVAVGEGAPARCGREIVTGSPDKVAEKDLKLRISVIPRERGAALRHIYYW